MKTVKDILDEELYVSGMYYDKDGEYVDGIDDAVVEIQKHMIAFATNMMDKIADIPGHETTKEDLKQWEKKR